MSPHSIGDPKDPKRTQKDPINTPKPPPLKEPPDTEIDQPSEPGEPVDPPDGDKNERPTPQAGQEPTQVENSSSVNT